MAQYRSTIVLVSEAGEFQRVLFDETRLFGATLDLDQRTILGPIAEFNYGSGAYQFFVTPDRVSLAEKADVVISSRLVEAARVIADALQTRHRPHHPVSAVGFNFEARFPGGPSSTTGGDFTSRLVNLEQLRQLTDSDPKYAYPRVVNHQSGLRYDIRLEPLFDTDGTDLLLAVNVHQDVTSEDNLMIKISAVEDARDYLSSLAERTSAHFEEVSQ